MNVLQKNIINAMPYARRYGRALTGDTNFADLVLTQASCSMLKHAPPGTFLIPNKIVLPWLLIEFHQQLDSNSIGSANATRIDANESDPHRQETLYEKIDQALKDLSDIQRRVFLLTTLEQFQSKVVGRILSIPVDEVKEYFQQAHLIVTEHMANQTIAQAA